MPIGDLRGPRLERAAPHSPSTPRRRLRDQVFLGRWFLLAGWLLGCGPDDRSPPTGEPRVGGRSEARLEFRSIAGGVEWQAEEPFVSRRPDNDMRAAQYEVRDHPEALLVVSHFPPSEGGGGDVRGNVERWVGQFQDASAPTIETRESNGLPVTTVDVRGTFVGRQGMGAKAPPRPRHRLLGAIVEGRQGLVFFKLLGPEEAIALAEDAFEQLVRSVHPI